MKELIFCVLLIAGAGITKVASASCCQVCYTQWFDRDDPSGNGDYETLNELRAENPGKICSCPTSMQVQALNGRNATTTGQVFRIFDTVNGFACNNGDQPNRQMCLDYKVRFACPCW
ncbi:cartilage intermediate layer protein 1-like [Clarias gariepinus]|uniref:cartilage intermediate layer protein 1-like n=1 Tax=Clarias gariepinus TaxID=13013 RepID=UPI00234CA323|nr:cartilage intermediate layer protein 1-like [Clarias gariepinus]